jgi:DNA polymerase III sliding clamp (beta) subunit (PCNA family)
MDTIERINTVTDSATVQLGALSELLTGASTHAGKDKALPTLNAVLVKGEGGRISATASDRYRLIEGTIAGEGDLSVSLIPLDDVKRILALLKGEGTRMDSLPVTLTRLGDVLTVSVRGNSISATLCNGNFPPADQLENVFNPVAISTDDKNIDKISFNPALFADYAKIAGKGKPVTITFTAKNKPMVIGLGGEKVEWRAALMPMRIV